jgi:hypothetical protein
MQVVQSPNMVSFLLFLLLHHEVANVNSLTKIIIYFNGIMVPLFVPCLYFHVCICEHVVNFKVIKRSNSAKPNHICCIYN